MIRQRLLVGVAAFAAVAAGTVGTFHSAAAAGPAYTQIVFNPQPIADPGTLPADAPVTVLIFPEDAGHNPVTSAQVFLSFAGPGTATANGTALTATPALFTAVDPGFITVDYTTASILPAAGSDVITAQNSVANPSIKVTDSYSYGSVTGYAWSVGPLIAANGTLAAGQVVVFTVTAENGTTAVPRAVIDLSLSTTAAPGGSATAVDDGVTRTITSATQGFGAGADGMVTITYTAPASLPTVGVDTLTALDPEPAAITAVTTYTFGPAAPPPPPPPPFHPTGVGAPDAVVQAGGSQLIFWRSSTNHLMEAWNDAQGWHGPADWTVANGWAATVDSTPSVTLGANGTQLVFWQGPGGHLFEAWVASNGWNGPVDWTANNHWAPSMSSAPSAVIQTNGVQMIFWQGGGHLFEAWVDVNGWHGPLDWTAFNHWAPSVVSAPTIHLQADGSQLIFWQGPGNHLFEAWFTGAWHGPLDWTAFEGWAPTVTSTPSVALIGSAQAIFWQGPGGHLFEAWNDAQGWHGPLDWTTWVFHGTFPLTSSPSVVLSGQAQLIWWQGAGGHLVEAWFTGSWNGPFDWSA